MSSGLQVTFQSDVGMIDFIVVTLCRHDPVGSVGRCGLYISPHAARCNRQSQRVASCDAVVFVNRSEVLAIFSL